MQNKLFLAFGLAGLLGGIAGMIIGHQLGVPLIGAIAGAFTFFPFGGYISKHQRRWLGMSFLNGLIVLAYFKLGWMGVGFVVLASFLTFFIAAGIVRNWYDNSDWKALVSHMKIALGLNHGFQIVENGKITYPKDATIVFGPRNLFIKPYNAVILERGSKQTRVLGPAYYTTAPFEYVKYIFNLKDFSEHLLVDLSPTREQILVDLHIRITYSLNINEAARLDDEKWTEKERQILQQLAKQTTDWKELTKSVVNSKARLIVKAWGVDQLLATRDFSRLESQIQNLSNDRLKENGIKISDVLIEKIEASPDFYSAQTEKWIASTQAEILNIRDRARAEAYREALRLIATAYQEAHEQGMDPDDIHRELLRRTIEQLSGDPSVLLFAPMLKDLMNGLNRTNTKPKRDDTNN